MELYSLQEVDIFTEAQTTHEYYEFNKDYLVDEATLISARQTVNKIFADIYAGTVLLPCDAYCIAGGSVK